MSKKTSIVSIVGRRNVGKSTLFNAISKSKKAIVDDMPGLTRDIITVNVSYNDNHFRLADTPGLDLPDSSELSNAIIENAISHLSKSSVIIFLLESPAPDAYDLELSEILRKLNVPIIAAVNKMDNQETLINMGHFYEMGFQDFIPISAARRININMLLDRVCSLLPGGGSEEHKADINIAIIGKPNAGKSTLLNAFTGYTRSIVSEIPGTTRDSVDESFKYKGSIIRLIDTAGLRKKRKITEDVEFYSMTRAIDAITKSDVVIYLIDATYGLTETDKKIFDEIIKAARPTVIGINKWDKIEKETNTFREYTEKIIFRLYRAEDFPIISISALKKQRISRLLDTCIDIKNRSIRRIETPKLNKAIEQLVLKQRIPRTSGKIKIYYATQTKTAPPRFKFFVNDSSLFRKDILRFFEKTLQKEFDMFGIPVIIELEDKKDKKIKKKS